MDLHSTTFERTASGDWKKTPGGLAIPEKGLASTQRAKPSSEKDLVIGDHVVFFNHLAYDLINERVGNAWRLENAVFIAKEHGKEVFLGHGSGRLTAEEMLARLAQEFNIVAQKALDLVAKTKSGGKSARAAAQAELSKTFPKVTPVGSAWHVIGVPRLLESCAHSVDVPLKTIHASEVLGLKSPCNPATMNEVERPIESAK